MYPHDPADLFRSHPAVWNSAFGLEAPMTPRVPYNLVDVMRANLPCRCSSSLVSLPTTRSSARTGCPLRHPGVLSVALPFVGARAGKK